MVTVRVMTAVWSVFPRGVNWKGDAELAKPVPPLGVKGGTSGGACAGVAAAQVAGAGLATNMAMSIPVLLTVTQTVRLCAMAVFCPKRSKAMVSS